LPVMTDKQHSAWNLTFLNGGFDDRIDDGQARISHLGRRRERGEEHPTRQRELL